MLGLVLAQFLALALLAAPVAPAAQPLSTPPPFERTFSFWIEGERVGAVQVRFDGRRFHYASTTVVRRGRALEMLSFSCDADALGRGRTSTGVELKGPVPSTMALWMFRENEPERCIDVEDEHDGSKNKVCAQLSKGTLSGTLLGEHFEAELAADSGPSVITLPAQHARFVTELGVLPLPKPRDLFGAGLDPGPLSELLASSASNAHVHVDGPDCSSDLVLDTSMPVPSKLKRPDDLPAPSERANAQFLASKAEVSERFRPLALEATAGVNGPWPKSVRLAQWLSEFIEAGDPELDEHDPVATWTRRKSGCVGSASVFAAMANSLGLHVRIVYGALLEDGRLHPHAWNEVEIDGRFYAVDASRGEMVNRLDHFPLARSDDADPLAAGRCLLALPRLRWTVVEVGHRPR
jgi:transglutaminase-like putative cysteine protease